MNIRDEITPRKPNGKLDWMGFVRTTWPIVVAVIGLAFWIGGRMESPEQKSERIRLQIEPLVLKIEALTKAMEKHTDLGWHGKMGERMSTIEEWKRNVEGGE